MPNPMTEIWRIYPYDWVYPILKYKFGYVSNMYATEINNILA